MSTSWVDITVSNVIVQIDIVWYIFETRLETKYLQVEQKIFLQYKIQCLEKVNVKYVIKRL
jgi:hypothetical protein